ncbi:MAG: hypothetical protein IPK17_35645, partial [Chloroflexi bacterium]|uniref:hypothetical protein n=1 Tax=Candidatus Flexifilum breve TaxID=3140694 RepID=UPI0031353B43|nr:hypothetical protein [Chloroflexota bacterium]
MGYATRVGFSIADSWQQFGMLVNVRQVDNAEPGSVQNTNSLLTTMLKWTNCIFTPNYLNAWNGVRTQFLFRTGSQRHHHRNMYRWNNETVDQLVLDSMSL